MAAPRAERKKVSNLTAAALLRRDVDRGRLAFPFVTLSTTDSNLRVWVHLSLLPYDAAARCVTRRTKGWDVHLMARVMQ
eukprot:4957841-Pyramimonas_sp.AAC.1